LLPLNIALVCFDFAGSGMSGGVYASLGFYEQDDLGCVVNNLRGEKGFSRIAVWGYSMGGATALMHAARDPSLAGVVADSPFCDLWQLIQEVCARYLGIMSPLLVSPLLAFFRMMIQKKAAFDICEVSPRTIVANCFVPAFFLHGDKDTFIAPSHSEALRHAYTGEASFISVAGGTHSSRRPIASLARAAVFLVRALRWEEHLPPSFTEEALAEFASTGSRAQAARARCLDPKIRASEIQELLASQRASSVSFGLVRAACALTGAYHGASLLKCSVPASSEQIHHFSAQRPVTFLGQVTFPVSEAEASLCWVEDAELGSKSEWQVYFAMFSATSISLTRVQLVRGNASHGNDDVSGGSFSCAGLTCSAVETIDIDDVELAITGSHKLSLCITPGCAFLKLGSSWVGGAVLGGATGTRASEVHLWALQWTHRQDADSIQMQLTSTSTLPPDIVPPHPRNAREQRHATLLDLWTHREDDDPAHRSEVSSEGQESAERRHATLLDLSKNPEFQEFTTCVQDTFKDSEPLGGTESDPPACWRRGRLGSMPEPSAREGRLSRTLATLCLGVECRGHSAVV